MNITMDANTTWVLIVACFCAYWSVAAWANRGKS
jgi:hypothetical protein